MDSGRIKEKVDLLNDMAASRIRFGDPDAAHILIRAAMVIEAADELVSIANRGLGVTLPARFAGTIDDLESALDE